MRRGGEFRAGGVNLDGSMSIDEDLDDEVAASRLDGTDDDVAHDALRQDCC